MHRFSGHETFQCKEQWLIKGLQLLENHNNTEESEIQELGVGRNMVKSIKHWLRAFGWISNDQKVTDVGQLIKKLDPYLEHESTAWLLQYNLCKEQYASIFNLIFYDYFSEKVTNEFSESSIIHYVTRKLKSLKEKEVAENTLKADFKVFVKTYLPPKKNVKTIEEDFNAPLLQLGLILDTQRKNGNNESIYRINKTIHASISPTLFKFILLDYFESESIISLDEIRKKIGSILCLSLDGIENLIAAICEGSAEFVFKDDAGIKQLQIKSKVDKFQLLAEIYENK
jgi:hypothetical protein